MLTVFVSSATEIQNIQVWKYTLELDRSEKAGLQA